MYKPVILTTLLILSAAASVVLPAAPAAPVKTKTHKAASLICPVTGEKIAGVKDAVGHSTYKGKTYYFCCPGCKPEFDKDPAKYVKNSAMGKFASM